MSAAPPHPAKFSDALMPVFVRLLDEWCHTGNLVLDPFAGTGRIHELRPRWCTTGVEIEPKWAFMSPHTIWGDSTLLPFRDATFDAVLTSPTYGNRMADHHNDRGRCRTCKGSGYYLVRDESNIQIRDGKTFYGTLHVQCEKCNGSGVRHWKRMTYRHQYGEPLQPNNSGQMHWGPKYWDLHERVWAECIRVMKPGTPLIVNTKSFIRKTKQGDEIVDVANWHVQTLVRLGMTHVDTRVVDVPSMRFGANYDKRVPQEDVNVLCKLH